MADRPLIFSAPMIAALLAGRKTRRKLYVRRGEDRNAPEHLARRLANGLDDAPDDGCWVWQRTANNHGYGTLTINGRQHYAHRLAYELGFGPIPEGTHLLHRCDNPRCINPAHLRPGSQSDNMADAVEKGRLIPPIVRMIGVRNGAAKLNDQKVVEIRALLGQKVRQREIASRFQVSQTLISRIALGRLWR